MRFAKTGRAGVRRSGGSTGSGYRSGDASWGIELVLGRAACYTRVVSKAKKIVMRSTPRKRRSPAPARARSASAIPVDTHGGGITTLTLKTKTGLITIVRSHRTGRFATAKSAKVIDRGAERFAASLKRLATK
jgi:hypothetical protein